MEKMPAKITATDLARWLKEEPKPKIIDVREDNELEIASMPIPVIHLPLSQASRWQDDLLEKLALENSYVVVCHSGIRSWNFALWLLENESRYRIWNLTGGIDAWSVDVDNSVTRY